MSGLNERQLAELVKSVVSTYTNSDTINHLGGDPLPDTDEVIALAKDLREILFPGYFRSRNLRRENVSAHVGSLLDSVHMRLTEQISRAVGCQNEPSLRLVSDDDAISDSVRSAVAAELFLKSLPDIRRLLASDVQAAFDGDPAASSIDEVIFCYPGVEAITIHRMAHALYRLKVPIIPRVLSEWSHQITGIDLHPGATIGPSFFIDHGTGVVIGETCEIGSGVTIYQSVTLGAWSFPRDEDGNLIRGQKRHPTIEDNVVIYSNATVLGGTTTVGANSSIGAGVSLSRSVPANTIVTVEKPQLRFREAS
jgi:serine O-acetyltransferase